MVVLCTTTPPVAATPEAVVRPAPEVLARPCLACHTATADQTIPLLSGKSEHEFTAAMREFRDQRRTASVMDRIARGYRDEDFANLAKYFAPRHPNTR